MDAVTKAGRATAALLVPLENARSLDPLVGGVRTLVRRLVPPGSSWRDLLHGVATGHPLHPVLVQLPMGAWISAAVLDLLPGRGNEKAARTLVGLGVATAAPAALAGAADWSEAHPEQQRVGIVHAAANLTAVGLYAASFVQRCRGRRGSAKVLAAAGLAMVTAGGYLGGHLAYRQASGANHAEDAPHRLPSGWQPVGAVADLAEGRLSRVLVGGVPVLLHREGEAVTALADSCSHLGGPLHEGELVQAGAEACVVCPWHGSVFSLKDGAVVHGPATAPQPSFSVRVVDGVAEIHL